MHFLKTNSENLKSKITGAEKEFLDFCLLNNIFPTIQKPIYFAKAIVDFAFPAHVILEIDGGYHNTHDQIIKDEKRTKKLNERGWLVVRAQNEEVKTPKVILKRVFDAMKENGCIYAKNIEQAIL